MARKAMTMVEMCLVVLLIALISGGIFMIISNTRQQGLLIDQRLHFHSSAQVLFEVLKTDLRALKNIIIVPEQVVIEKVTDFNSDGEELSETVTYKIVNGIVTRSQGDNQHSYHLISDSMRRLGQTTTGTFCLNNLENSDDFNTGTFLTCFSVKNSSDITMSGFEASMSVDIRWLN